MLVLSQTIYQTMFSVLPVGILLLDEDRKVYEWNAWLESSTGITKEQVLGQRFNTIFPDMKSQRFDFAISQVLKHKHPQILSQILNNYIIPIQLPENSLVKDTIYMQQSVAIFPIEEKDKGYAMVVIRDVTESYQQRHMLLQVAKRFEEESIHDELTGLYNRRFLWEYLITELSKAARDKYAVVCTMYDLDHFKQVNDELGHEAGDSILKSFAEIITNNIRLGDKAFRYGGEEFITISSQVDADKASDLSERIRNTLMQQKVHVGIEREVTCSVGVALAKPAQESVNAEELIKQADEALYKAKITGRNRVCSFNAVEDDKAVLLDLTDFSHIEKIASVNEALQKEFYSIFIKETEEQLPTIEKVFEEMLMGELAAAMHQLKSSAKAIGATRLASEAEALEKAARTGDKIQVDSSKEAFLITFHRTVDVIKVHLEEM